MKEKDKKFLAIPNFHPVFCYVYGTQLETESELTDLPYDVTSPWLRSKRDESMLGSSQTGQTSLLLFAEW